MRRTWFFGGAAVLVVAIVWRVSQRATDVETVFEPPSRVVEPAPMCPWRAPESDLKLFFPGADQWQIETRILSGKRPELEQRLGRPPAADENVLPLHRVFCRKELAGTVLTRRAKGEHGAIEIVLAVNPDQSIKGIRFQRLREPPAIAEALSSETWLHAFRGRKLSMNWNGASGIPLLAPQAKASGAAVVEAVRSLLILLAAAEQSEIQRPGHRH